MLTTTEQRERLRKGLLSHLERNIVSMRFLLRERFAREQTENAFNKWFASQVELDWFAVHDGCPDQRARQYVTLGERACSLLQLKRRLSQPLPPRELGYQLGCLFHTSMGEIFRKRFVGPELARRFPWLPRKWHNFAWYLDQAYEQPLLAQIRVEPRAYATTVLDKLSRALANYREIPQLAEWIDAGRFLFAVITATPQQAERVVELGADSAQFVTAATDPTMRRFSSFVRLEVHPYPALRNLGG